MCVRTCARMCVLLPVLAQGIEQCRKHVQVLRSQKASYVCPVSHSLLCSYFSGHENARLSARNQSSVRHTLETLDEAVLLALRRLHIQRANPSAFRPSPLSRGSCQLREWPRSLPAHPVWSQAPHGGQVDLDQSRGGHVSPPGRLMK